MSPSSTGRVLASASPSRELPGCQAPVGARAASAIDEPKKASTSSCALSPTRFAWLMSTAGVATGRAMVSAARRSRAAMTLTSYSPPRPVPVMAGPVVAAARMRRVEDALDGGVLGVGHGARLVEHGRGGPGDPAPGELVEHAPGPDPDDAVDRQPVTGLELANRRGREAPVLAVDLEQRVRGLLLVEALLDVLDVGSLVAAPQDRVGLGTVLDAALERRAAGVAAASRDRRAVSGGLAGRCRRPAPGGPGAGPRRSPRCPPPAGGPAAGPRRRRPRASRRVRPSTSRRGSAVPAGGANRAGERGSGERLAASPERRNPPGPLVTARI